MSDTPHAFNGGPADVWPLDVRIAPLAVPNDIIVMQPPPQGGAGLWDCPADPARWKPQKLRGRFRRIELANEYGLCGAAEVAYEPTTRTLGVYRFTFWRPGRPAAEFVAWYGGRLTRA
ncbi:MAG: hypothetical protein IBJ10_01245 [Phycisphaerales bacterium]|nr:hypothetical protein [Phycisphaerales bacterium]